MITDKHYVYILSNKRNTVLYVGRTKYLYKRTRQHKKGYKGFTSKYNVTKLVYYEYCTDLPNAIKRENQLKNLLRRKKESLIEKDNPNWVDLFINIEKS